MNDKFIACECGHGGLWLQFSRHFGLEISNMARDPYKRNWSNRLKLTWACIKGQPYSDMVVLNNAAIIELADYLTQIQTRDHETEDHEELISSIVGHLFGAGHCQDAVEGIIAWAKTSDCSQSSLNILKKELAKS